MVLSGLEAVGELGDYGGCLSKDGGDGDKEMWMELRSTKETEVQDLMIVEGSGKTKAGMGPGFSLEQLGQWRAICQAIVYEGISQWEGQRNSSHSRSPPCQMFTSLYILYIYPARFPLRVWL